MGRDKRAKSCVVWSLQKEVRLGRCFVSGGGITWKVVKMLGEYGGW